MIENRENHLFELLAQRYLELVLGVADGWASKNPRSSTTLTIDYHGKTFAEFRIASTMTGKVNPQSRIDLQCDALSAIGELGETEEKLIDPRDLSVWAEWEFPSELEVND
jgi:hypothetical protein